MPAQATPPTTPLQYARFNATISDEPYNKSFTNLEILTGAFEDIINEAEYRNYGPFNGIFAHNLDADDDVKLLLNASADNFVYVPANSSVVVAGKSFIFSFLRIVNVGAGTIAADALQLSIFKYFGAD